MRYYIDSEFNEEVDPVRLISLAIVAEDGRELYLEFGPSYYQQDKCNDWVQKNVLPLLGHTKHKIFLPETNRFFGTFPDFAKHQIEVFVRQDSKPEFWGYFADYDWYLFCRLWGNFWRMPQHFPHLCLDVKQLAIDYGVGPALESFKPEHHALVDARWTREYHTMVRRKIHESR